MSHFPEFEPSVNKRIINFLLDWFFLRSISVNVVFCEEIQTGVQKCSRELKYRKILGVKGSKCESKIIVWGMYPSRCELHGLDPIFLCRIIATIRLDKLHNFG